MMKTPHSILHFRIRIFSISNFSSSGISYAPLPPPDSYCHLMKVNALWLIFLDGLLAIAVMTVEQLKEFVFVGDQKWWVEEYCQYLKEIGREDGWGRTERAEGYHIGR
jgi:hypothetical protein